MGSRAESVWENIACCMDVSDRPREICANNLSKNGEHPKTILVSFKNAVGIRRKSCAA